MNYYLNPSYLNSYTNFSAKNSNSLIHYAMLYYTHIIISKGIQQVNDKYQKSAFGYNRQWFYTTVRNEQCKNPAKYGV